MRGMIRRSYGAGIYNASKIFTACAIAWCLLNPLIFYAAVKIETEILAPDSNINEINGSDENRTIVSDHSTVNAENKTVIGNHNSISGDGNDIVGHHNIIYGNDNTIRGNSNRIYGKNNIIQGNHNGFTSGDGNSVIRGNHNREFE
ncbi:MAG: hypothetical protein FWH10_07045 [Oscillospiraceae bacterium]|nr:hypothetical protein [Oscillospiraceae bacterium]